MQNGQCKPVCPVQQGKTCLDLAASAFSDRALLAFHQVVDCNLLSGCKQGSTKYQRDEATSMMTVRAAFHASSCREIELHDLRAALVAQLSRAELELVYSELSKDAELHQVLIDIDATLVWRESLWRDVTCNIVQRKFDCSLPKSMYRSALGSLPFATTLKHFFHNTKESKLYKVDDEKKVLLYIPACVILSSMELYSWCKGESTSMELAYNVGQHTVACASGCASAYVILKMGIWAAGAAAGGPCAWATVLLATVGCLTGGFLADLGARMMWDYVASWFWQSEVEDETMSRALSVAAHTLDVDLQKDDFDAAKSKFRTLILECHPDRAAAEDDHQEQHQRAASVIAAWQVVREHYKASGLLDDSADSEQESVISLWVVKTRQRVGDSWRVVRTWFGGAGDASVHRSELAILERTDLYL